jgi:hypothetical protein
MYPSCKPTQCAEAGLHIDHASFTVEQRLVERPHGLVRDHGNIKNGARIRHDFGAAYSANEIQYVQSLDAYAANKGASDGARSLQPRDRYSLTNQLVANWMSL